jgi:hypothetical protein
MCIFDPCVERNAKNRPTLLKRFGRLCVTREPRRGAKIARVCQNPQTAPINGGMPGMPFPSEALDRAAEALRLSWPIALHPRVKLTPCRLFWKGRAARLPIWFRPQAVRLNHGEAARDGVHQGKIRRGSCSSAGCPRDVRIGRSSWTINYSVHERRLRR